MISYEDYKEKLKSVDIPENESDYEKVFLKIRRNIWFVPKLKLALASFFILITAGSVFYAGYYASGVESGHTIMGYVFEKNNYDDSIMEYVFEGSETFLK